MGWWNRRRVPDNPRRIAAPEPAPDKLKLLQDFANTTGPDVEVDELGSVEQLADWLIARGLLAEGTDVGRDQRRRAVDVRWGLRSMMAANNGAELHPEAVHRLKQATAGARLDLGFDDRGPSGFEQGDPTFDDALGSLLAIVAMARLEGRWRLFKICARSGCRRAFYDFSQGRNAVFCTRRCADRDRQQDYRRRKAQRKLSTG